MAAGTHTGLPSNVVIGGGGWAFFNDKEKEKNMFRNRGDATGTGLGSISNFKQFVSKTISKAIRTFYN